MMLTITIIKTDQEIRDILHSRYNSRPDSEDQYDENGSYHFDNLNIDRICTIYNTLMDKNIPKPNLRLGLEGRLIFQNDPPRTSSYKSSFKSYLQ